MKTISKKNKIAAAIFLVLGLLSLALGAWLWGALPTVRAAETEHDHADGSWTKLTEGDGTLRNGNYYLTGDLDLTDHFHLDPNHTVTLCLNGHKLTGGGSNSVIIVSDGANFTLCDCNGSNQTHYYTVDETTGQYNFDGVTADTPDAQPVVGGVITGGSSNYEGGGVYVISGTFEMSGTAAISGNRAFRGGGVRVSGDGTFTMSGGTIAGNSATVGGGVYVEGNSTFTMSDSTISDNKATGSGNGFGGGVYFNGTFTMQGGTIGGSEEGAGNSAISGGGVYFSGGTFTMQGGTISGNSAISYGGGVYFSGTEFTMQGGTIRGNTATSSGGGVYVNGGEVTISGGYLGGTIAKNKGSISIEGGYFEKDPQAYLAGGYTVVMLTEDSGDENYKEGFPYAVYKSGDEAAGGYALSVKGSLVYDEEALTAEDFAVTVPEGYTGTPSWQYKEQGGSDWADGFPTDAGEYTVKAIFPADADHAGAVVEVSFTVAPLSIDVIWELMDQDSYELQTPEGNEYNVPYCVDGYSV